MRRFDDEEVTSTYAGKPVASSSVAGLSVLAISDRDGTNTG